MKINVDEPKIVRFCCNQCGQDFEAPAYYGGKEVSCSCGLKLIVPSGYTRREALQGRVGIALFILVLFGVAWFLLVGIDREAAGVVLALGVIFCIISTFYFLPLWLPHAVKICLVGGICILLLSVLANYFMGAILGGFLAVVGAILILRK